MGVLVSVFAGTLAVFIVQGAERLVPLPSALALNVVVLVLGSPWQWCSLALLAFPLALDC
jgi:hypothetical protein